MKIYELVKRKIYGVIGLEAMVFVFMVFAATQKHKNYDKRWHLSRLLYLLKTKILICKSFFRLETEIDRLVNFKTYGVIGLEAVIFVL